VVVAALLIGAAAIVAAEIKKAPSDKPANTTTAENARVTYLGVCVEPLYSPLGNRLPELLGGDQGVLVASVVSGSPAEKAGIMPSDVLMTYGGEKLFSPEQFAKLVKADKAGREVALSLIREGNVEQITATLGEHEVANSSSGTTSPADHAWWHWRLPEWQVPHWRMPHWFTHQTSPGENDSHWQSFDSMTIKSLGDNRYKAEIQYLDKQGKMQRQEFEGTREEIHKAVLSHKDLPDNEREHLLRGLNMPGGEMDIPSLHVVPGHGFTWDFGDPGLSL
jgi:hypothetical protein